MHLKGKVCKTSEGISWTMVHDLKKMVYGPGTALNLIAIELAWKFLIK
jgi:hypothetical protein